MERAAWRREDAADVAAEKILDAAAEAFVAYGVAEVAMSTIAEFAGCSRGTLYRYFKTRGDLQRAYVARTARTIFARVGAEIVHIEDPATRLHQGILRALAAVRGNPATAAWFRPEAAGTAERLSRSSEAIDGLTVTFVEDLLGASASRRQHRLRARWLVRVVVSLLAMPAESAAEEAALIEQFVVRPMLTEEPGR